MPGVYISYPFCTQKCSFCNFASGVAAAGVKARYGQALLSELARHEWNYRPETVYFGGGTPSLMEPVLLRDLMDAIPRERLMEATLECAPGTISADRIGVWRECGINRVSLGVQSFVTDELRRVGRRHTAETVSLDVQLLREGGIENINLDLIAGLPQQTAESWEHSLGWIERLKPPHVSIYLFEVDEDSRLGKEVLLGGTRYGADSVPGDDLGAELYETAVERLERVGILRYEISNFARPGWESRHNLKYWQLEPYVGFGLDAHSFDGRYRWGNPDSLDDYFDLMAPSGGAVVERVETNPLEERFFVGLRLTQGIAPSDEEWSRFADPIEKWIGAGMLERTDGRLRLSSRGHLVSNEILQEFVNV